jgi:NhaP-type Na+/H+ or K+/H+ antiporter
MVTRQQSIIGAGLFFTLVVLGVVILAALRRGESDVMEVLTRAFAYGATAFPVGLVLGYIGLRLIETVKEPGKPEAGSEKQGGQSGSNREGGTA